MRCSSGQVVDGVKPEQDLLTPSGLSTTSNGSRCWRHFTTTQFWRFSFRLSGLSTARTPRTCGTTMKGAPRDLAGRRGRARGPLHAGVVCSGSARSPRSDASPLRAINCTKGRCSLRSSTTSTSSVIPRELVRSSSKLSSRSPGLRVSK